MKNLVILLFVFMVVSCGETQQNSEVSLAERAEKLHQKIITIDTHDDINVKNFTDSINYTQRLETQINLPKMNEGGLDVAWLIVYTGQDSLTDTGYAKAKANAISKFDAIHKLCEEIAPDQIELALSSEDVRRIVASGKKVAMIGVENAYPLGTDLSNFEAYYNRGARYVSLAHNGHSQFSDSNTGEADNIWLHNGLSNLGKEAVKEMNRLGIMIDVSHPSKEAFNQMIALSKAPLIASHSSARALCDHSRNLDDDQLKMMKKNGGVVQTVAFKSYLNTEKYEARNVKIKALEKAVMDSLGMESMSRQEVMALPGTERDAYIAQYMQVRGIIDTKTKSMTDLPPAVDVGDFVDHIDYMVKLIGIDHVGISSDFDGGGGIEGWSDASETFNVTLELVKRGYTEDEIEKLWGGNLLRVLDEVEAVAAEIQKG